MLAGVLGEEVPAGTPVPEDQAAVPRRWLDLEARVVCRADRQVAVSVDMAWAYFITEAVVGDHLVVDEAGVLRADRRVAVVCCSELPARFVRTAHLVRSAVLVAGADPAVEVLAAARVALL